MDINETIAFLRRQFYGDEQDDDIRTALLKNFIRAVIYDEDKVIIVYNTKDTAPLEYLEPTDIENLIALSKQKRVFFKQNLTFLSNFPCTRQ